MHLESLLQGTSGGSEQVPIAPTAGGTAGATGTLLVAGSVPAALTTDFSVALGVLTHGVLDVEPEVGTPGASAESDAGGVAAEFASDLAVPAVIAKDVDFGVALEGTEPLLEVGSEGAVPDGAAGPPVAIGPSGLSVDPGVASTEGVAAVTAGVGQAAVVPILGSEPAAEAATSTRPPSIVARGLDPALRSIASTGGEAANVSVDSDASDGQSAATESSPRAPADGAARGSAAETASATIGRVVAGEDAVSTAGGTPALRSNGTAPPPVVPQGVPAVPSGDDVSSVVAERAPTSGTLETGAASRHENNVEPTMLAAVQPRVEVRRTRDSATTSTASRVEAATADPTAAVTDGAGQVAGVDAGEEGTEAALLRAGGDASIPPVLQGLIREAAQRQRAQATLGQAPGPVSSDANAGATTVAPGTAPQTVPSSPASMAARIDQPQGFAALAERIVDGLQLSAARGGSEIRLRVDPPGLGHVDVRIQLQDDGVRAMIVAEHEGTRALLSSQQHLLEAALGRSELKLSGFSVDVSLDHGAADFHDAEQGDGDASSLPLDGAHGDGESTEDAAPAALLDTGRLSLRV